MRGDAYLSAAPSAAPDEPVHASTAQGPSTGISNIEENMQPAIKPGSIYWLLALWGIVGVYYYLYNAKWKDAVSKDGILTFLHQSFVTTALVVVGVNLANVFFTKLAALKIPLVSRGAGAMLTLFHL
jgi:hypothetical protein